MANSTTLRRGMSALPAANQHRGVISPRRPGGMAPTSAAQRRKQRVLRELGSGEAATRSELVMAEEAESEGLLSCMKAEALSVKDAVIARLQRVTSDGKLATSRLNAQLDEMAATTMQWAGMLRSLVAEPPSVELAAERAVPVKDARLKDILADVSSLVGARLQKDAKELHAAVQRNHELAFALHSKTEDCAAAERVAQSQVLDRCGAERQSAELFRGVAEEIRARADALDKKMLAVLDATIRQGAQLCYQEDLSDPHVRNHLCNDVIATVTSHYSDHAAKYRELLRDIHCHLQSQTAAAFGERKGYHAQECAVTRWGGSRLPEPVRRHIAQLPREDLLQLLDFVSFEPHVSDSLAAVYSVLQDDSEKHLATREAIDVVCRHCDSGAAVSIPTSTVSKMLRDHTHYPPLPNTTLASPQGRRLQQQCQQLRKAPPILAVDLEGDVVLDRLGFNMPPSPMSIVYAEKMKSLITSCHE